jgi:RimJ/RimL family protein N-acetyltransferase
MTDPAGLPARIDADHSPPVFVPRLRTSRLTLREYRPEDFDAFAAFLADPVAMEFLHGVEDRRNAWRIFAAGTGAWMLQGAGWWSVELRDSGTLVGTVGAFFRESWPELEIGWNILRPYWGRGIATEAAAEVIRYAFEVRRERSVVAIINPRNAPSLRVAERLAMSHDGDVELFGHLARRYVKGAA